jgi:hypothetical protein
METSIPQDIPIEEPVNYKQGDSVLEKPLLNTFYDCESILTYIKKTYQGEQLVNQEWVPGGKPIARTKFINDTINMLRSVINAQNFNSGLDSKQIDNIMLEKNLEYIERVKKEPDWSLDDKDSVMVIDIFDHVLQTFFGIIENGKTSDQITQMSTGVYNPDAFNTKTKEQNKGFFKRLFG